MIVAVTAVVVVLALVAAGVTALVVSSNATTSAPSLYRRVLAAAGRQATFRYTATSSGGGQTQVTTGVATRDGGTQSIDINGAVFRLVLVADVVYFDGDVGAVESQLGLSAATAQSVAGTWVSVARGDAPYTSLEQGITTSSALSEIAFTPKSVHNVGGAVLRLSGAPEPMKGHTVSGTAKLDVAAGTHLPRSFDVQEVVDGQSGTTETTFRSWNQPVSVSAPSGATPYSSLPPGGGGSGSPSITGPSPTIDT